MGYTDKNRSTNTFVEWSNLRISVESAVVPIITF